MRFYFDHNATTPVAPEVLEAMLPALADVYGNASSIHQEGQRARRAVEEARREVALLLGADPAEIVFTSGGTEADNMAVLSVESGHVITAALEHPAVLKACAALEARGVAVTYLAAGASGVVDPEDVRRALRPDTKLVAVMHANNELGTVQPLAAIAEIAREAGARLHADGVQGAGKLPVDVRALGVDTYAISAHKFHGPKGVGALYVRKGVALTPLLHGGRQQQGQRPGTENVAGAVGLGRAAKLARETLGETAPRIAAMRDRLEQGILALVPDTHVNCGASLRTPNTTSITFRGIEGEPLVIALDLRGFAVSSGAACSSGAVAPSHVLLAIGLKKEDARSTIRFSLGRGNTAEQVDALIEAVAASVAALRKVAPAYA